MMDSYTKGSQYEIKKKKSWKSIKKEWIHSKPQVNKNFQKIHHSSKLDKILFLFFHFLWRLGVWFE